MAAEVQIALPLKHIIIQLVAVRHIGVVGPYLHRNVLGQVLAYIEGSCGVYGLKTIPVIQVAKVLRAPNTTSQFGRGEKCLSSGADATRNKQ